MSPDGKAKINAAAKLRTLELYLELRSFVEVAKVLGITPTAVRSRLHGMNIRKPPETRHEQELVDSIRTRLLREAQVEEEVGTDLPARSTESEAVSLSEDIRTLEAFIEHHRYAPTGRALGIGGAAARDRLYRILGRDKAYPVHAKVVLEKLRKKLDQEKRKVERKRGRGGRSD